MPDNIYYISYTRPVKKSFDSIMMSGIVFPDKKPQSKHLKLHNCFVYFDKNNQKSTKQSFILSQRPYKCTKTV